jgi:hypothetical protein
MVQESYPLSTGRLQSRAAKLPLPTVGKDFSLSYESIIERTMHSEALLQPLLRQNAELEKELEKERLALERDEEDLMELQANAKSQEMVRAQQVRTVVFLFSQPAAAVLMLV